MSKQKQRQQPKQHGRQPPKRPVPKKQAGIPPWLPAVVTLGIVGIAIAIFLLTRPSQGPPRPNPSGSAAVNLVGELSSLPVSNFDQVGKGSADLSRYQHVSEPALTQNGKPELLYMGAEYCPYCAAERWAIIVALSRFGSLEGVQPITSSEGGISTFTFRHATFTSSYVAFVSVEEADANGNPLQTPTAAESALASKYGSSGIPFLDHGNRWTSEGTTYVNGAAILQGLSWQQIIDDLKQPGTAPAQGILGAANVITASLCQLTNQQPGQVCSDPVIQSLERQLPSR